MLKGRWGAARLVAMTGAPVIPVGIWGTEQVWPRSERLPNMLALRNPPTITIRVGRPVEGLTGESPDADTEAIMAAIVHLLPPEARKERTPTEEELAKTYPGGKVKDTDEAERRPATTDRSPAAGRWNPTACAGVDRVVGGTGPPGRADPDACSCVPGGVHRRAADPGVAHAKGPDQATIDGAGMVAPISVDGTEGSDDDLGTLVELAGLLPAVFGQTPDPMLAAAPKEGLGPKLVITWRLPDGGPTPGSVQQELYLYAEGGPLTYTAPDQPFMGGDRTTGGWFRTPTALQPRWETLGLPTQTTLECGRSTRPAATRPHERSGHGSVAAGLAS